KYRPKGGPSGGNGGRGGDVVLEADHDLNNLIAQYFQPRLIAEDGQGGLGKGMDGHAGADLLVKVPCGTLVWQLPGEAAPTGRVERRDTQGAARLRASSSHRPLFRAETKGRALEIDLTMDSAEECSPQTIPKCELGVDLT